MIKAPNPWVVLAGTTFFFAGMAWSFWQGQRFERGQQALEEVRLQAVEDRAAKGTAKVLSGMKVVNQKIYNEVQREIIRDPVYVDCRLPPDGLRLLNAAIEGRALPAGDGVVPPAGGAGEP